MTIWEAQVSFRAVGKIAARSLTCSLDFYQYFKPAFKDFPMQEALIAVYMDIQNQPVCMKTITVGLADSTPYHPREIIGPGLIPSINASRIAIAHNHPSGNPQPSQPDKKATLHLKKACEHLDVHLREHIVVGADDYFSFSDQGYLNDDFKTVDINI